MKGSLVQLLTFLEHSVIKHHPGSRSRNRWATGGGDEWGGFTPGPGDRRKVITAEPIQNTSVCRGYWWRLGCSAVKISINQSAARTWGHSTRQASAGYAAKMYSQQNGGRQSGIKCREKRTGSTNSTWLQLLRRIVLNSKAISEHNCLLSHSWHVCRRGKDYDCWGVHIFKWIFKKTTNVTFYTKMKRL